MVNLRDQLSKTKDSFTSLFVMTAGVKMYNMCIIMMQWRRRD